jgi:hypothetical protein
LSGGTEVPFDLADGMNVIRFVFSNLTVQMEFHSNFTTRKHSFFPFLKRGDIGFDFSFPSILQLWIFLSRVLLKCDQCKDGSSGPRAKGSLRHIQKTGFSGGSLPGFLSMPLSYVLLSCSRGLRHNQI